MKEKSAYVEVKSTSGTYLTNQVNKQRASCTSGARQAVERLADKLFGTGPHTIRELATDGKDSNLTKWHIRAGIQS